MSGILLADVSAAVKLLSKSSTEMTFLLYMLLLFSQAYLQPAELY